MAKKKLKSDDDYSYNQREAQKKWAGKNPDYWKKWRQQHPEYVEKNRQEQRLRNENRRGTNNIHAHTSKANCNNIGIAKMDVSILENPFISGTYEIIPVKRDGKDGCVNSNNTFIINRIEDFPMDCKEMTL